MRSQWASLAALLATMFLAQCPVEAEVHESEQRPVTVDVHRNLRYRAREAGELLPIANVLDVYVPTSQSNLPVVFLVHGGAWIAGDKLLDFIPQVARRFAEQGFCVVAVNYRLSPLVRHPAHIEDVSQALAWTVENISQYGGRADAIFLLGHSAGGHLVSLAATDTRYIRQAGVSPEVIRAVISVSGVYQISDLTVNAISLKLRVPASAATATSPFALAFGTDPEIWRQASPQSHVQEGLPPFLLVTAQCDLPLLTGMADAFHAELQAHQVETQLVTAPWRTHAVNFWQMARAEDPTFAVIVDFLKSHAP